jgi:hypothetical protein
MKDYEEVKEIIDLLNKVKKERNIDFEIKYMNLEEEKKVKFEILIPIAIAKKIKIKQTKKTRLLYPHLVVYNELNEPITFYPQKGKRVKEVSIKEYLESFFNKVN